MQKITTFLWYDSSAEEAANLYISIFKNSKILDISYYKEAAESVSGKTKNSVMSVSFQIEGQEFIALNGGPVFKFTPAISLMVSCASQEEIDYIWNKLSANKDAEQCGWLQDKYGLSWQITPQILPELLNSNDPEKANRVMAELLKMKKIDINKLLSVQ